MEKGRACSVDHEQPWSPFTHESFASKLCKKIDHAEDQAVLIVDFGINRIVLPYSDSYSEEPPLHGWNTGDTA